METTHPILTTFNVWVPIITVVVLGVLAIFNIYDRRAKEKRKTADDLDEKIIERLQQTVTLLESDIEDLKAQREADRIRLTEVLTENKTLRDILQGRDEATLRYQAAGLEAMKRGEQILEVVQQNSSNLVKLTNVLEKHFAAIEKIAKQN